MKITNEILYRLSESLKVEILATKSFTIALGIFSFITLSVVVLDSNSSFHFVVFLILSAVFTALYFLANWMSLPVRKVLKRLVISISMENDLVVLKNFYRKSFSFSIKDIATLKEVNAAWIDVNCRVKWWSSESTTFIFQSYEKEHIAYILKIQNQKFYIIPDLFENEKDIWELLIKLNKKIKILSQHEEL